MRSTGVLSIGFLLGILLLSMSESRAMKFEGLAQTPPMGWNSWNTFMTDIDAELIQQIADAMLENGMLAAGYSYIVLDDGWMAMERDCHENLVAHPERFPHGMKALADGLHEQGFKFGLYGCAGEHTCAGYPGSQGHEYQDALYFATVGVDYLKYDWCNTRTRDVREAYTTMAKALHKAGRPVVFSLCEWGLHEPWKWARKVGHLWRTTGDITDCYDCRRGSASGWKIILDAQMEKGVSPLGLSKYAGPGNWNDPDMLEVGNPGLTLEESRAHFSLWCVLAAPLMAGNDVRNMDGSILEILTNREAIAINQDPLGKPGWRFLKEAGMETWIRELSGGDWAICVLNTEDHPIQVSVHWKQLAGLIGTHSYSIRDIWEQTDPGSTDDVDCITRLLPSHDVIFLRLIKNPED